MSSPYLGTANRQKIVVPDTSAIISDPNLIDKFSGMLVVMVLGVLKELDTFKAGTDQRAANARKFIHWLDDAIEVNPEESLIAVWDDKIKQLKGGMVVGDCHVCFLEVKQTVPDEQLLHAALVTQGTLLTSDTILRIMAHVNNIQSVLADPYQTGVVAADIRVSHKREDILFCTLLIENMLTIRNVGLRVLDGQLLNWWVPKHNDEHTVEFEPSLHKEITAAIQTALDNLP